MFGLWLSCVGFRVFNGTATSMEISTSYLWGMASVPGLSER